MWRIHLKFSEQVIATIRSDNMLGIKSIYRGFLRPSVHSSLTPATRAAIFTRTYAQKKRSQIDISKVPIKHIGCLAEFYVPPQLKNCPTSSWHRLLLRRFYNFALNTANVARYRFATKNKVYFNDWKEKTVENYVKTNKAFAAACSTRKLARDRFIKDQLSGAAGTAVIESLIRRSLTFPADAEVKWKLLDILENPKVVTFTSIPDESGVPVFIQLVTKVKTKQEMTVSTGKGEPTKTERLITDYLVSTIDPNTNEVVLVGSLFESDHIRKVQPEVSNNHAAMEELQRTSADIYRDPPKSIGSA